MTRKKRRLSPEEEQLWQKVADTAKPIKKPKLIAQSAKMSAPKERDRQPPHPIRPFQIGEAAQKPATKIFKPAQPLQMDRKAFTRMKRGKSKPEARIDLHGMTVDVAHSALIAFLMRSHSEGKRLVLVITGKGRSSTDDIGLPRSMGILRQQLPHWLDLPPLRQIVLQWHQAHLRHGGSGAFYVYLRR